MRNGQSFAIAGLLQSDFADSVSQMPGIGNIPILGALTRSSEFQRQETELVIIITPYLVQPVDANRMVLPTDFVVRPYDLELYLAGFTEAGPLSGNTPPADTQAFAHGGLDGPVGYVIE